MVVIADIGQRTWKYSILGTRHGKRLSNCEVTHCSSGSGSPWPPGARSDRLDRLSVPGWGLSISEVVAESLRRRLADIRFLGRSDMICLFGVWHGKGSSCSPRRGQRKLAGGRHHLRVSTRTLIPAVIPTSAQPCAVSRSTSPLECTGQDLRTARALEGEGRGGRPGWQEAYPSLRDGRSAPARQCYASQPSSEPASRMGSNV